MKQIDIQELNKACERTETKILSLRNEKGIWGGQLSSSALSTAVAVFALWKFDPEDNRELIDQGLQWLHSNINSDGGFGDSIQSSSNLSTSLLCWSALSIVKDDPKYKILIEILENYLKQQISSLEPHSISKAILNHYKTDHTFSVPILAMCAIAGRLGEDGWKYVPQLPYQFAAFPDQFFKRLNLSVVSYAIPALIAIGLVKQHNDPSRINWIKNINTWFIPKVLKVLKEKQPDNGGFLEAAPLTAFVLMSLTASGHKNHPVCKKAVQFLQNSIRKDGSWPIDTSLTTWVSTLSVNALNAQTLQQINPDEKNKIYNWLINQQHRVIHPFTKSKPGGWAWIDSTGGVPDGDDTSGALLALHKLSHSIQIEQDTVSMGIHWLINNQNSDGGFPTFCRGWGKLPFDASCADITAHAIRALLCWRNEVDPLLSKKINHSLNKAIQFLIKRQRPDGSWLPLWFGNENDKNHLNPVYGTAQVLLGLIQAQKQNFSHLAIQIDKGASFLRKVQNADGGWGGNAHTSSSIEESALAVRALTNLEVDTYVIDGTNYLIEQINRSNGDQLPAAPIGLYFASLWYYEEMYPWVYSCSALNEIRNILLNQK